MKNSTSKKIGDKGEDLAVYYLESKGYTIVERNFHSRYGEIDIIAALGDAVIFVEVKYRKNSVYGNPASAVDYRKQEKLKKTALIYISQGNLVDKDFRFDIIEITGEGEVCLNHIINAFC